MRELQDLMDIFPYCLLVALPIMIILSPTATVAVGHEFPAHRLAQLELGGVARGPKAAALSMDARAVPSESNVNLLRKTVISRIQDLSVTKFNDLVVSGAGGVLLLMPSPEAVQRLSASVKESINALQEHLHTSEFEIPIYFADESQELLDLLASLGGDLGNDKKPTAYEALFSSISNYGYQLVSANSAVPKAISDPQMVSIEAVLRGSQGDDGDNDAQPTIVLVAHYDSDALAPSLPSGVNSNGSGVAVLMELARILGKLYASSRSRPPMGIAFLLSSGGSLNYFGTKKWLESHLDQNNQHELLNEVPFVACLDTLSGSTMKMHVSKPPKADSHAGKFLAAVGAEVVHKKINLADELLAWEHERFSIRRLPAFTLSALKTHDPMERSDLMDNYADPEDLYQKVKQIGEALVCTAYNYAPEGCSGNVLSGSLAPSRDFIASWIDILADTPRAPSMTSAKNDPFVQTMLDGMKSSLGSDNVRSVNAKRETREPEFVLFDGAQTKITAYKVKPAVFDLVLTLCIGAYLGLVYLAIMKSGVVIALVSSFTTTQHSKTNGVLNNNASPNHLKAH